MSLPIRTKENRPDGKNDKPRSDYGRHARRPTTSARHTGVLVQMAQRGQIIELRCEMPKCYCHKGRGYFEPRSTPLPDWAPSPDHYPRLKADGGHLVPWNVRLSHVLCNREDYGWRMRIRRMIEKGMSLEKIAENLNHKGIRRPHGSATWSATSVRKAFVS
jgi:hypothetical protein